MPVHQVLLQDVKLLYFCYDCRAALCNVMACQSILLYGVQGTYRALHVNCLHIIGQCILASLSQY